MNHIREEIKKAVWDHPRQQCRNKFCRIKVLIEGNEDLFSARFHQVLDSLQGRVAYGDPMGAAQYGERLTEILKSEDFRSAYIRESKPAPDLLPVFKVGGEDKDRMLKLCADIRKIVTSSSHFDHSHRIRLLNRVTAVESEIHKEKGLFDVVLGMVSDFGETAGKFGSDIKPLTDRVREIASIARKNTDAYDQLPEPDEVKQLPGPSDEQE